jgi:hypothetical protein
VIHHCKLFAVAASGPRASVALSDYSADALSAAYEHQQCRLSKRGRDGRPLATRCGSSFRRFRCRKAVAQRFDLSGAFSRPLEGKVGRQFYLLDDSRQRDWNGFEIK